MIRAVVRGDRMLGQIHYADLPERTRCPKPLRVRLPLPYGRHPSWGHDYEVVRCVLDRGHGGECAPPEFDGDGVRPPPATRCAVPMRDEELWTLIDVRPGDRVCDRCRPPVAARGRPVGAEVRFYYDHDPGRGPQVGDALVTDTGKTYLLTHARVVARGGNAGRRTNLRAVIVAGVHDLPEGTVVHGLAWYKRERRRQR